jgi:hypothetical protein
MHRRPRALSLESSYGTSEKQGLLECLAVPYPQHGSVAKTRNGDTCYTNDYQRSSILDARESNEIRSTS